MNPQPVISVIVPIYNVEPYIRRCIDSIITQTYHNLEIILVDDGSPDNCGRICDEYAQIDNRIVVIHRSNGGLSAARNTGLDICTGEYVGFVDSDDYIHPTMYQKLYDNICEYQVKLAFCQANVCKKDVANSVIGFSVECKSKEFVILQSMIECKWWSACTKLYHRSLFDNIRYPEGLTNEDYPVTIRIYDLCDFIVIDYNKLYNYCIRENSICTSSFNIRKFDQITNSLGVLRYMEERHFAWRQPAEAVFITTLLKLLFAIYDTSDNKFDKQKKYILLLIKKYFISSVKNKYILKKQRFILLLIRICPDMYSLFFRLYNQYIQMKI